MKQKTSLRFGTLLLALVMCLGMTAFAAGDTAMFNDVTEDEYFYEAVQWGLENEITNGVGHNCYDPMGTVTRAQAVTFLWRMAGRPEPSNTETFSDVKAGSWYETAVQWAVQEGITEGTGSGKFSPNVPLDRAMCLTMLYRMQGSPYDEAAAAEPVEMTEDITLEELGVYMIQQMIEAFRSPELFPDVEQDSYYELAVVWGGMNDILTDDNTGTMEEGVKFRPTDPCTRGEMISFLYQTKLMQDRANAPELDDLGPLTLPIPKEYFNLVFREYTGMPDEDDGILITISEIASREAAEAMGQDPDDGAGELFSIGRVGEEEAQKIMGEDLGGAEVFAKDENGKYYVFYTPTDVRYLRETNEQMAADQEQWDALVAWAHTVPDEILKYSDGLTAVTFTNTPVDMRLARAAYQDAKYTVSTNEFGPAMARKAD